MTEEEKLKHCRGCTDDYYNDDFQPKSTTRRCWSLPAMECLVSRLRIPVQMPPPYKMKPVLVPPCKREKGYAFVNPEAIDSNGVWKR